MHLALLSIRNALIPTPKLKTRTRAEKHTPSVKEPNPPLPIQSSGGKHFPLRRREPCHTVPPFLPSK